MKHLGKHIILELWGCDSSALDDEKGVKDMIIESVNSCGATLIKAITHKFSPQGVTCIAAIAESHISVHTWPEYGYCAVDIFTCGTDVDPLKAIEPIKRFLKPERVEVIDVKRGTMLEE